MFGDPPEDTPADKEVNRTDKDRRSEKDRRQVDQQHDKDERRDQSGEQRRAWVGRRQAADWRLQK